MGIKKDNLFAQGVDRDHRHWFRTTDLAAIDNGEYIPGNSKSFPTGLATAYREIGVALAREYGLEKESYALDSAVINRKINISGQTVDISAIVEEAFEKLATNILVEINSQWRIQDLDRLIVTGGGGQAISSYLLRQLPQAELAAEPNIANCSGFLAWGTGSGGFRRLIWKRSLSRMNKSFIKGD